MQISAAVTQTDVTGSKLANVVELVYHRTVTALLVAAPAGHLHFDLHACPVPATLIGTQMRGEKARTALLAFEVFHFFGYQIGNFRQSLPHFPIDADAVSLAYAAQ